MDIPAPTRPDFNPTACLPCNGQGTANNSSWWPFVSEGGNIVINVTLWWMY
ncbi:MAG: hypothetical protein IPL98_11895 [Saprospiraceae bacterium]|nr:hypothetical protein [Saprospiraceae bacterium]